MSLARTLCDKLLASHTVRQFDDDSRLVLIDRIMLHERTGAVALRALSDAGRKVRDPASVFCMIDHIVDTQPGRPNIARMPGGADFINALRQEASAHGLTLFDVDDPRQGVVHVVAPDQGIALPGLTMICPDSHTCTLGGLGALAWGVGSTDAEHALATKTLRISPLRQMRVTLTGLAPDWLRAKDIIIHLIARHSAAGAKGFVVEFAGQAVADMDIEARLTLCNMGIEFGAFSAVIAPDEKTLSFCKGRPFSPGMDTRDDALDAWTALKTDPNAVFDQEIELDVGTLAPAVTWGTSPEHAVPADATVPEPTDATRAQALAYMGLTPGTPMTELPVQGAYIGSCTNARLSDLRRAAAILRGQTIPRNVRAICVPGSTKVKAEAEAEGLDHVFRNAGFEWHDSGCGMCFYAGGDGFGEGDRVISSTNRNFEGRQGPRVRTHIASPETVALSALRGRISDLRDLPAPSEAA